MSDIPLRDQQCHPLDGGSPMGEAEARALLPRLQGWSLDGSVLERRFKFDDFHRTMAFVNAVAWIAHGQDHHPDMAVGYGHCTLRFSTHSVGGLSMNDFICAAKVDALLT